MHTSLLIASAVLFIPIITASKLNEKFNN